MFTHPILIREVAAYVRAGGTLLPDNPIADLEDAIERVALQVFGAGDRRQELATAFAGLDEDARRVVDDELGALLGAYMDAAFVFGSAVASRRRSGRAARSERTRHTSGRTAKSRSTRTHTATAR